MSGPLPFAEPDETELREQFLTLADFEAPARERVDPAAWEYLMGGAGDEITVRENTTAFDAIRLRPRVLRDVSRVDTRLRLFEDDLPAPILLAPAAYQGTIHREGEMATARGAGRMGAPFVLSTAATASVEEVAAVATAPLWFQMYVQSDRGWTEDLVRRVEAAGCRAICVTVDTPVLGTRVRQKRARFELPPGMPTPHLYDVLVGRRGISSTPKRVPLTWRDIAWLRSVTSVPLLLKGILDPDDAEQAVALGANGLIVSNHGGRNLDTVPATIVALPAVADRVAGRIPVLADGGVRRGTDVLKCLALGAQAVLVGRPYLWALGAAGAGGVARMLAILREDFEMAMALTGRASLGEIDAGVIW